MRIMPDPKGDKLFVNIGASEARRRLRGFGHGVRKVQSAGRNQSAIIHTATGRHLQELETKFADVGFSGSAISANLSKTSETLARPVDSGFEKSESKRLPIWNELVQSLPFS